MHAPDNGVFAERRANSKKTSEILNKRRPEGIRDHSTRINNHLEVSGRERTVFYARYIFLCNFYVIYYITLDFVDMLGYILNTVFLLLASNYKEPVRKDFEI
jgi:hypothetical protein